MTAPDRAHATRRRKTAGRTSDPFDRRAARRRLRFALLVATAGVFTTLLAVDLWSLRGRLLPGRTAQTGILVRDNPQADGNVTADVSGVDRSNAQVPANDEPVNDEPDALVADEPDALVADAPDAPVADAPHVSAAGAPAAGVPAAGASGAGASGAGAPAAGASAAGAPYSPAAGASVPPVPAKPAAPSKSAPSPKPIPSVSPAASPKPARDPRTAGAAVDPRDARIAPGTLAPVRFVIPQPGSRLEFAPSGELSERLVQAARRSERIVIRGRVGPQAIPTAEQDAAVRAERARRFLIVRGVPAERIWIGASVRAGDGDRALIIDVSTRGEISDDAVLATAPTRGFARPRVPAGGPRE